MSVKNFFRRFKSRRYLCAVFALFLVASVGWWLPTATIVKFQPVCNFNPGGGWDETENFAFTMEGISWFGFLKGNLRPEFKEVMSAYFLGDRYRAFTGNDALGYYRVTPEGIHVTIDYYIDPDFYHRLTIKTIHTLIRRELWGGDNFPVYFYDRLPAVGGWEPMRRGRGRWDNKNFRPGSKLLQELNPDF